jgi:pimeloyl-ACP methyl ester carboxylesterase
VKKAIRTQSHFKPHAEKILKAAALGCLCLFIILTMIVVTARVYTYQKNHITSSNGIDEGIYVTLGGQEQYLLIRGQDVSNPIIVWLYGGPAGPDAYTTYVFEQQLTDDYTFVNWDQRGCGRTYYRNADESDHTSVTFEQIQEDLDELVDYLCQRFSQDNVIIIGHSFGTAIGSSYVLAHPDKVAAYIGVGQLVSAEGETCSYEDALEKAEKAGDQTSSLEQAYQAYLADPTLTSLLHLRSETNPYHVSEKAEHNSIWLTVKSPYFGFNDLRWTLKGMMDLNGFLALNQNLFDYALDVDVRDYGMDYQVPVGFISGAQDWTTPVECTEEYYDAITAPEKQISLIEGCGHYPQYEDTEAFCQSLREMLDVLISADES